MGRHFSTWPFAGSYIIIIRTQMNTILNISSIVCTQITILAFTENGISLIPNNIYVRITLHGSSLSFQQQTQITFISGRPMHLSNDKSVFILNYLDIFTKNGIDWVFAENISAK